jgi:hypothetical protein
MRLIIDLDSLESQPASYSTLNALQLSVDLGQSIIPYMVPSMIWTQTT